MSAHRKAIVIGAVLSFLAAFGRAAPPTIPNIPRPRIPDRTFKLTDFGAIGDGKTPNTKAFADAVAACEKAGGGKLVVPAGVYFTGPITLTSNLDFHLDPGATILSTHDRALLDQLGARIVEL